MMTSHTKSVMQAVAIMFAAVVSGAPARVAAQDTTKLIGPPIQKIATASAVSTEPLGSITSVRELPGGRLLLNDGTRRRLLLMDTTLKVVQVVLDSLTEVSNAYGTRAGALIPYRGDSTLFLDPASYAMLVLDPGAKIAKVRSVWRVQDLGYLTSAGFFGWPRVDAHNRVVYRIAAQPEIPKVAPPAGVPWFPTQPDSSFIVAVNLDTRKIDTLGTVRIPKQDMRVRQTTDGFTIDQVVNPLPRTDDWAVLPDGRVAFVRGQDYRIEYLSPDGKWTSSEKLPYDWQRLTDDIKKRVADSVRLVLEKQMQTQWAGAVIRWVNQYNGKYPEKFKIPDGFVVPNGFPKDWFLPPGVTFPANYVYACAPGETPPAGAQPQSTTMIMNGPPGGGGDRGAPIIMGGGAPGGGDRGAMPAGAMPAGAMPGGAQRGAAGGAPTCLPAPISMTGGITPPPPTQRAIAVVDPSELPDYKPPIGAGAVRADEDGNLWIRTVPTKPISGGGVYDIISPEGVLVNRLQLPPGYTIVGFGKGKVLYVSMRDASGVHLARVQLR